MNDMKSQKPPSPSPQRKKAAVKPKSKIFDEDSDDVEEIMYISGNDSELEQLLNSDAEEDKDSKKQRQEPAAVNQNKRGKKSVGKETTASGEDPSREKILKLLRSDMIELDNIDADEDAQDIID